MLPSEQGRPRPWGPSRFSMMCDAGQVAAVAPDCTRPSPGPKPWAPTCKVLTGALANIDPGTADGRLMLQVVGAMAEFERSLIKERTRAGLDAAKAQGRTGGRPSVVDEDVLTVARARRARA
ncbi:recombinase family protein [Streptomyces sp. KAU_LT]|uniref:recombinase family protein n=1 Tax=Streptomyces sp. KAU_LT TaxID=3046669 RepID=UPI0032D57F26